MSFIEGSKNKLIQPEKSILRRTFLQYFHIDILLLMSILLLLLLGLIILYSASNQQNDMVEQQILRIGLSLIVMFLFAQISPIAYQRWAPWIYFIGMVMLVIVLFAGHVGSGDRGGNGGRL